MTSRSMSRGRIVLIRAEGKGVIAFVLRRWLGGWDLGSDPLFLSQRATGSHRVGSVALWLDRDKWECTLVGRVLDTAVYYGFAQVCGCGSKKSRPADEGGEEWYGGEKTMVKRKSSHVVLPTG